MFNRHVLKESEEKKERENQPGYEWIDICKVAFATEEPRQGEVLPWALIFQNPLQVADVFPLSSNSAFILHPKLHDLKKPKKSKILCAKILFFFT